jgi:hypothetical protein
MKIWIISQDYGYAGLGEPIAAFTTAEAALAALTTLDKLSDYEITEIELEEGKP